MRALFDTNVLISYLLTPLDQGSVTTIIEGAVAGAFTLLLPTEVVEELRDKVATKPYLRARIAPADAEALVTLLAGVAEVLLPVDVALPIATRDADDDYVLAQALYGQADYLVTRDRDLLVLGEVGGVKIVSPAEFARVLQSLPQR